MSAFVFILRKQLKNIIRGLAKKPLALIGYILIGALMLGFLVVVMIMPSGLIQSLPSDILVSIITLLLLIAMYFGIRQGIERGSSYFRFSDVNFVFTAPINPWRVLLFGFVKNMGASLLAVFFMIFQIPNIKNYFVLADYGVVSILIAVLLYTVITPILGMMVYTFSSKSSQNRTIAKRIIDALAVVLILFFSISLIGKDSLLQGFISFFSSKFFSYIPVLGQVRTIAQAAIYGIDYMFFVSILILVAIIGAFFAVLYNSNLDFYEDVLAATEAQELKIKAKREGRDTSLHKRKTRKVKGGFSSYGAKAIFEKHLLEYRKTSFFLFFDTTTFFIILAGIGFKFMMTQIKPSIFMTLFFSAYMLFFFVVQGKWPLELEKPYIFLIPESNGRKVLYATLTENIKNLFDGTLLFIVAYFLYETTIPVVLLCIVNYVLYGAVYIYSDIVSRRLFSSVHSKVFQVFVKLFVVAFVISPGIIIMVIVQSITQNELYSAIIIALWNIFVVICFFLASVGIFKNMETD